jgi:hypothetical protein
MEGVIHLVEKYESDDSLERTWVLPSSAMTTLSEFVEVCDGVIVDVWPVTPAIAAVIQPWVDEPIDAASGDWFVTSCSTR